MWAAAQIDVMRVLARAVRFWQEFGTTQDLTLTGTKITKTGENKITKLTKHTENVTYGFLWLC